MSSKVGPRLWIISEVFYPDEDGTAYYMTCLAEHLARFWPVRVICGQPKYSARGTKVLKKFTKKGAQVERVPDLALDKNQFLSRILSMSFVSLAMFFRMARAISPGDIVLAVTSPPLMPILALIACRVRHARLIIRVDDVYPEALIASGMLPNIRSAFKTMVRLNGWLFKSADRVVVLGRDMEKLVRSRMPVKTGNVDVIHNWADLKTVKPSLRGLNRLLSELGLEGKDIVQCAGNMGRVQAIETMFGAVELLKNEERYHFLFIGNGQKRKWMERQVADKQLKNVTLLDFRARSSQNVFLNACDISMASLIKGMAGVGVPSRLYNVMAAGKPLIAVAEGDSELAMVVEEEKIGWVVPPDEPAKLAEAIREAFSDKSKLAEMGRSARNVAEQKYSPAVSLEKYRSLVEELA